MMADTTWRERIASFAKRTITPYQFPNNPAEFAYRFLSGIVPSGGQPLPRGTVDYLRAYGQMPWLRAATSRINNDIAATQWQLTAGRRAGKFVRRADVQRAFGANREKVINRLVASGDLVVIEDHPMLDLVTNANPLHTGMDLMRVTQTWLDLVGDAYWLIEFTQVGGKRVPVAIWPLPPYWILNTPTPSYPWFRVSFRGWQAIVPVEDMVWFKDVDPLNPYWRGVGVARSLGDELEIDEYSAKHIKNFYANRARPDLLVWPKGEESTLKPGQVDRLEEQWTSRTRGFWNAFKPFFLSRAVEVKELAQNFANQDLLKLRQHERDTILQVYGVSPEILGIIQSGGNRATITMSETIYQRRVLVPRLELLRIVMQERLVPMFDERIIMSYESPVVRDQELELEAAAKAPWAPNTDEWRAFMGLPPLEDRKKGALHIGPMTSGVMQGINDDDALPLPPIMPEPGEQPLDDGYEDDDGDAEDEDEPDAEQEASAALLTRHKHAISRAKTLFDAGQGTHKGLLVSLWLDAGTAEKLAVPGGEPASDLHVTLGYCGRAADIPDTAIARALLAVDAVAASGQPLSGYVGGVGRFSASESSEGRDVVYAVPDVVGLAELRQRVAAALVEAGVPPVATHGWSPHITLAYVAQGEQGPTSVPRLPLSFGAVTFSVGTSRVDLALRSEQAQPERLASASLVKDAVTFASAGDVESARLAAKYATAAKDDEPVQTQVADRHIRPYRTAQVAAWGALSDAADVGRLGRAIAQRDYDEMMDAFGGAGAVGNAVSAPLRACAPQVFMAGAQMAMDSLPPRTEREPIPVAINDVTVDLNNWILSNAGALVRSIDGETRRALAEMVAMATEQGMGVDDLARMMKRNRLIGLLPKQAAALRKYRAKLVAEGVDAATLAKRVERYTAAQLRLRATTIARTELMRAVNAGQQAMWQLSVQRGLLPKTVKRVWLVTLDDALCEKVCEPLTNATAGLTEPFPGGYQQPPAHPRCRCTMGLQEIPSR